MKRFLWPAFVVTAAISAGAQDQSAQPRQHVTIVGAVAGVDNFAARFGPDFEFRLTARGGSWNAGVFLVGQGKKDSDLSEMTIPWRGPNARYIVGWNLPENANAPGYERSFVFSPEVGDAITWDMLRSNDMKEVDRLLKRIYDFGHVDLALTDVELTNVPVDIRSDAISDIKITSFKFRADCSWPAAYKGIQR